MDHDSRLMRGEKPYLFTNCKTGEGIPELVDRIRTDNSGRASCRSKSIGGSAVMHGPMRGEHIARAGLRLNVSERAGAETL
jgi:hypothetical protein